MTLAACATDDTPLGGSADADGMVAVTLSVAADNSVAISRADEGGSDPAPTRCFVQVFTTTDDGVNITPVEGNLREVRAMVLDEVDGSFHLDSIYLHPSTDYVFLYWADNGTGAAPTDLRAVSYAKGSIAFAKRQEWRYDGTNAAISERLTHAVAKVTLKTTTDLPASSDISVALQHCYDTYNVSTGAVSGESSDKTFSTTVSTDITGSDDGTEVFSFYALTGVSTQEVSVKNGDNGDKASNVPLGPDKHTTLVGDVRYVGLQAVTFTASVDENWGSNETVNFPTHDINNDGDITIESGTHYIVGNGQPTSHTITINGDAEVHLKGVNINSSNGPGINITSGSPTLVIEGENSVTSSNNTAVAVGDGATVTITGENGITDKLTAIGGGTNGVIDDAGTAGAGIGSLINATTGGNIIIENVTVEATGATTNHIAGTPCNGGAGIGSAGPGSCGNIEITNAVITATGGIYAAAIGLGYSVENSENSQFGKIDITNSIITATGGQAAAVIGFSYLGSRKSATGEGINITTNETAETFLAGLTLNTENVTGTQYKIGKGAHMSNATITFNGGVTLTASNGTQTHADGIGQ